VSDDAHDGAPSDVVPLSRWRALLARSRGAQKRVDAILADPAAPLAVRRLPAEDLFFLLRSVGLDDAGELLGYAAPAQLRACADLDLWRRDRLDVDRTIAWLEALEGLGPVRLATVVDAFDVELLALLVRQHAQVHDRSLEERPPDDTPHAVVETPDGFYWLEFTSPDRRLTALLARLLDQIYKTNADRAMAIVREARWSYPAELEESAYQFRSRRLEELGFADHYEALGIYQPIDIERLGVEAPPRAGGEPPVVLPVVFAEALADDLFLGRVLAAIDDGEVLGRVADAVVVLLNRVLAADLVDPGDLDAVLEAATRARDTLSLGLEHLAGGVVGAGVGVLARLGVGTIFRVGYTLGLRLGRRATQLRDGGVDDPDLLPLLERRPLYPRALDAPPYAGARPFRTPADVARVEARLAALAR
jgi:hypothetical protein